MQAICAAALRRFSRLGGAACLTAAMAWQVSGADAPMPRPHDGAIANGLYTNRYFDLSYPVPPGWTEGTAGPGPSHFGHYVLSSLMPVGEPGGMILISAQDMFFAAKAINGAAAMAREIGQAMSAIDGMTIDRQPSEETVAGRRFGRVDFSGVGLFRSMWITEIRCHFVSFHVTANSPGLLASLVSSLNDLDTARGTDASGPDPACLKNQADTKNLVTRVDPPAIAPFTPIPVRVIIGADGGVKHVHVIRATAGQRSAIETALGQWKFKPPETSGAGTEIETGLLIEFTPEGNVRYSPGDRVRQF